MLGYYIGETLLSTTMCIYKYTYTYIYPLIMVTQFKFLNSNPGCADHGSTPIFSQVPRVQGCRALRLQGL